jgi:hypothetical protein
MTTFFVLDIFIRKKKLNMLFNVNFKSNTTIDTYTISGDSWSQCVAYCEGTGKEIQTISIYNAELILNDSEIKDSYYVSLSNNVTEINKFYLIFDTYQNTLTWIESQSDSSLTSLSYQKRTYILI